MKVEFIKEPVPRTIGFEDKNGVSWTLAWPKSVSQDTAIARAVILAAMYEPSPATLPLGYTLQTDEEFHEEAGQ